MLNWLVLKFLASDVCARRTSFNNNNNNNNNNLFIV